MVHGAVETHGTGGRVTGIGHHGDLGSRVGGRG